MKRYLFFIGEDQLKVLRDNKLPVSEQIRQGIDLYIKRLQKEKITKSPTHA